MMENVPNVQTQIHIIFQMIDVVPLEDIGIVRLKNVWIIVEHGAKSMLMVLIPNVKHV